MVATFNVMFDYGGSDGSPGNSQNVDGLGPPNIRFKTNDNPTIDENDPVPIVTGQTKRSYWKQIYLKCTGAPSVKCNNFKFYTDGGGFGTGITLNVAEQFPTKNHGSSSGYEVATGTPGDTGDEMVANHAGVTSKVDAFGKTQGSPLNGPSVSEDSNQIDAVDETTNYLVFQLDVADTAQPGNKDDEDLTIQYDEI